MDGRPLIDSPEPLTRSLASSSSPQPLAGQGRTSTLRPEQPHSQATLTAKYPLKSLLVTLVRHGESQDNLRSIWAGYRDSPLSTTGQSQARAIGKAFSDVPIVAIYSSDLKRAASTANEILLQNNSNPPPTLVQSQSLREQNFGQAEGKPWSNVEWQLTATVVEARTQKFKDGESLEDVNARVATAVRRFLLPRIEALRKEPLSATQAGAAEAASGYIPEDCPHIVITAHGIAIQELLRVLMSLHDSDPPGGLQPPWPDPKLSYKRVRLDNTGWTRLEIAVPATVPANGRVQSNARVVLPAPTGTGVIASQSGSGDMDSGQIQTQMVEGPADASRPTPSAPTAQRSMFVRILVQNHTDHLKGFAGQAAGSGAATSLGGAEDTLRGGIPPSVSTPAMNSGSLFAGRSPNGLVATPASAKSLSAYDGRFLAREIEKAASSSNAHDASSSGGATSVSSAGLMQAQSAPSVNAPNLQAYNVQSMLNEAAADMSMSASSDTWQTICVKILPLFNGEGLKTPFDELNTLVSVHVRKVIERGPARALDTLSADIASLAASGTYTLNSRLSALQGEALLRQLVRVWVDYFCDIVPNVETSFLPVITDSDLISLTKARNAGKAGAANGTAAHTAPSGMSASMSSATPLSSLRTERVQVRAILLSVFRDELIVPRYLQLFYLFAHIRSFTGEGEQQDDEDEASDSNLFPRLLQMVNILVSLRSEGEAQQAVETLLKVLRLGGKGAQEAELAALGGSGGSASANSHGQSRQNRRGWLPRLALKHSNFAPPTPPKRTREMPNVQAMSIGDEEDTMDMLQESQEYKNFLESDEFLEELKSARQPNAQSQAPAPQQRMQHPYSGQPSRGTDEGKQAPQPPLLYDPRFSEHDFLNSLRSPAESDALSTPQRASSTPPLPEPTQSHVSGLVQGYGRGVGLGLDSEDGARTRFPTGGTTSTDDSSHAGSFMEIQTPIRAYAPGPLIAPGQHPPMPAPERTHSLRDASSRRRAPDGSSGTSSSSSSGGGGAESGIDRARSPSASAGDTTISAGLQPQHAAFTPTPPGGHEK